MYKPRRRRALDYALAVLIVLPALYFTHTTSLRTGAPFLLLIAAVQHERADESLRQGETQYRTLVENAPDIISRIDRNMHVSYTNPAPTKLTGVPAEQFLGKTASQVGFPAPLAQSIEDKVRTIFGTGQPASRGCRAYASASSSSVAPWRSSPPRRATTVSSLASLSDWHPPIGDWFFIHQPPAQAAVLLTRARAFPLATPISLRGH